MKAAFFVCILAAHLAAAADQVPSGAVQGAISAVTGIARLRPASSEVWEQVSKGQVVRAGDVLRTMQGSRLQLILRDGAVLFLGPLSTAEIRDSGAVAPKAKGALRYRLKLLAGAVLARIMRQRAGDVFAIETPSAVASVKGTRFALCAASESGTELVVFEGLVRISNGKGGRDVPAGFSLFLSSEGAPGEPIAIDPKHAPAWLGSLLASGKGERVIRAKVVDRGGEERELILRFSGK